MLELEVDGPSPDLFCSAHSFQSSMVFLRVGAEINVRESGVSSGAPLGSLGDLRNKEDLNQFSMFSRSYAWLLPLTITGSLRLRI